MNDLAKALPDFFVRVSDDWYRYVHGDASGRDYSRAYSTLRSMQENTRNSTPSDNNNSNSSKQRGGKKGRYREPKTEVENFFQKIIWDNVMTGASEEAKRSTRIDMFPGPMAVQLGRMDLLKLKNNDYWITEKSDGYRVMLLVLRSNSFPRWVGYYDIPQQPGQPPAKGKTVFGLIDTCAIETSVKYCQDSGKPSVVIRLKGCKYTLSVSQQSITLTPYPSNDVNNNTQRPYKLKQEKGWSFAYLFDRTYTNFYLCIEEFVFPTRQSMELKLEQPIFQRVVLLDGEVVYNIHDRRYNYTVYDIVCCSASDPKDRNYKNEQRSSIISFRTKSMEEKINAIKYNVIEPHYYYYAHNRSQERPRSLQLIRKHFYRKQQLNEVLACIRKDETTGEFFYKGYNKNDGLVFTPNDPKLYTFAPGANPYLLKWKWPEKLTADFLAKPLFPIDQLRSVPKTTPNFAMFFSGSGRFVYYRSLHVSEFSEEVENRMRQTPNAFTKGVIAECGFDRESGEWFMMHTRVDKDTANGYYIIASTLENIIEDIDQEELKRCMTDDSNDSSSLDTNESVYYSVILHFGIRRSKRDITKLALSYEMWIHSNQDNECPPAEYGDTQATADYLQLTSPKVVGPNGETGDDLERLVFDTEPRYHSAGSENCYLYARAVFLGNLGQFKILDFKGDPNKGSATDILAALEELAVATYKRPTERRQQPQQEARPQYQQHQQQAKTLSPPQHQQQQKQQYKAPTEAATSDLRSRKRSSDGKMMRVADIINNNDEEQEEEDYNPGYAPAFPHVGNNGTGGGGGGYYPAGQHAAPTTTTSAGDDDGDDDDDDDGYDPYSGAQYPSSAANYAPNGDYNQEDGDGDGGDYDRHYKRPRTDAEYGYEDQQQHQHQHHHYEQQQQYADYGDDDEEEAEYQDANGGDEGDDNYNNYADAQQQQQHQGEEDEEDEEDGL